MPRIDYTFGDAKNEVLANVNDFDGDVYRVRAKELMFEGINMLVYGNDYLQEDIPGMIMRVPISLNDLSARGAFQWSSPLNTSSSEDNTDTLFNGKVLKILNITPNFDTGTDHKYTFHKIDDMYKLAMTELFEGTDAIQIIKLKDIYESMETASDRCVDVADVVEDIVLKYT